MKKCLLLGYTLMLFLSVSFGQGRAEKAIEKLFNEFPQEKLVLNLSKSDFVAGETIFFKAYTLNGYIPSELSTNLYVELYDANQTRIDSMMMPLYKGTAEGSLHLPAKLAEGVYHLRAYTSWMLNFDERLNYLKAIRIYNPYSSLRLEHKPVKLSATAHAESGHLRPGILSKVVLRLDGSETLPDSFMAAVYEKGQAQPVTIANSFNSQVALLQFFPEAGKSYVARVWDGLGDSATVQLPMPDESGTVLHVAQNNGNIGYAVHFGTNNPTGAGYKIIGTIHDELVFRAEVKRSNGVISGNIETKDFPNGILRFTVFNENENVVAERLCFIKPMNIRSSAPAVLFDTLDFSAKAINSLRIGTDSIKWYTYSLQVDDGSHPRKENFLSALYLTSDITSAIVDPGWYFENTDQEKAAALDALLITETWPRFNWREILADKFPNIRYAPETYLSFIATVSRKNRLEKLQEVNLIMGNNEGFRQFALANTDSTGRFLLSQMVFADTLKIFYQLNSKKVVARDIRIDFEPLHRFSPLKSSLAEIPFQLVLRNVKDSLPAHVQAAANALNNTRVFNEKVRMLENITISHNRKSPTQELNDELSSGMFLTQNEVIFDFINENQTSAMSYNNILDWLQGRVAGFSTEYRDGVLLPKLRNTVTTVFIDEFATDPSMLQGFPVHDIAMVKVIKGVFLGTAFGSEGAIAIYTKRGGLSSKYAVPQLPNSVLKGYSLAREFFQPDYSEERLKDVADSRDILVRKDLVVPDEDQYSRLRFYNNDHAKNFRVTVTGFTSEGLPVYLDKIIYRQ